MHSALSRLCRFSAFIAHVLVPYVNTLLDTGPENLPPSFMWCEGDTPWAVRMSDSSLNLAQAHCVHFRPSRLIHTSSCTKCVTQIAELRNTFQLLIGLNHNLLTERGHSHPQSTSGNGNQHIIFFNFPEMPLHLLWTHLIDTPRIRLSCHQLSSCKDHTDAL